jgi:integrase/recombinase XerD
MNKFETYLEEEGFKPDTIAQHRFYVSYFLSFIAEESLALEQITYTEILDYADRLKQEGKGINLINRMMLALRYYFNYLQYEGFGSQNPVAGIALKGAVRVVPHDLLSMEEMEALYEGYTVTDDRTHRNKVILGLLIYQAITREELEALRPEHLLLRKGEIDIPQIGRHKGRTLFLKPSQVLDMQEYILLIRPKMVSKTPRLFTGRNDQADLKNTLLHLFHALRKLNPKVKHATQIRQSVITEWLKTKDLRIAQYMAGHRFVSSTEHYRESNMEELKDALSRFHPLEGM